MENFKLFYQKELGIHWQNILREETAKEEALRRDCTVVSTPKMRRLIWKLCQMIGDHDDGTPGAACKVAEMFFASQVKATRNLTGDEQETMKNKLIKELIITLVCAVFIASKITGGTAGRLNLRLICCYLSTQGIRVTPAMIIGKEFEILKSLDFKLPLWTGVDMALAIAMAASMGNSVQYVAAAMNTAEYLYNDINADMSRFMGEPTCLSTTHLAVGVVVAVAQKESLNVAEVTRILAEYCDLPIAYVMAINNIITTNIHQFTRLPV